MYWSGRDRRFSEIRRTIRKFPRPRRQLITVPSELLSNLVYADEIKRQPGLIVQSLLR